MEYPRYTTRRHNRTWWSVNLLNLVVVSVVYYYIRVIVGFLDLAFIIRVILRSLFPFSLLLSLLT
eukprot:SAG31_NODE_607_length_13606_cov_11.366699_4_plen_65_part_00